MAKDINNSEKLEKAYKDRKALFHIYIYNIKKKMKVDVYSIINTTLIKNPYSTNFPKKFFLKESNKKNKTCQFIVSSIKFYSKQFYYFISYVISFILYKIYYKKNESELKNFILIDVFFLVDNIIKENEFNENYLINLYDVLDKYGKNYVFLPRLYGSYKNPFKLMNFFKIINQDKRSFLFEFELLSFVDFISIFSLIVKYPFKTLRLIQKERTDEDVLFNNELIKDISSISIDAFTRYIIGKKISKLNPLKVYTWSEFQVNERSFNYGFRTTNDTIKLYGCQFYLNYDTYFNAIVDDIDFIQKCSFHYVLVNAKYYLLNRKHVKYKLGVSLRYQKVFLFNKAIVPDNIVLLGTFFNETTYMLECLSSFKQVLFKNHPIVDIKKFGKFQKIS